VRPPGRVSSLIAVVYLTSSNSDSDFGVEGDIDYNI
jgi:hypothetical protein